MFIDVTEIRKSPGQTFHFDLTGEILSLKMDNDEVRFREPVQISLDVRNVGRVLEFTGSVSGDTELVCSRCLERYPFHLDSSFAEKLCQSSDVSEAAEEGHDTADIRVFEGSRVELDDLIAETIVLGIPMKSVCDENCHGLCSGCGTNLNKSKCECKQDSMDPRLEILKKLL